MLAMASKEARGRLRKVEVRAAAASASTKRLVRERLDRAFGHWAKLLTRIVVRFEDLNGPRGGVDCRCAIDVHPAGLDPVHYESTARNEELALGMVVRGIERTLRRVFEKRGYRAGRTSTPDSRRPRLERPGSLVGRREGRGALRQAMARVRPEKDVGDLWTDTAQPATSATDRTSGSGHTARRNARVRRGSMTVLLEDSLSKQPSRKSTRRSANRGKPSQGKERTAAAMAVTPSARHRRRRAR